MAIQQRARSLAVVSNCCARAVPSSGARRAGSRARTSTSGIPHRSSPPDRARPCCPTLRVCVAEAAACRSPRNDECCRRRRRRETLGPARCAGGRHGRTPNCGHDRGELGHRARDRAPARTPGLSIRRHRPLGSEGNCCHRSCTRGRPHCGNGSPRCHRSRRMRPRDRRVQTVRDRQQRRLFDHRFDRGRHRRRGSSRVRDNDPRTHAARAPRRSPHA